MITTPETRVTDLNDRPPNPFSVPGLRGESMRPLLPWRHRDHEGYYLAVDHTQRAYELFCDFLSDPEGDLTDGGRLVVVAGERGCGKSSVINRCVNYVVENMIGAECEVVDLTTSTPMDFGGELPVPERMDTYLDRLADEALTKLHEKYEIIEESSGAPVPAQSAYAKVSRQLGTVPAVAVVILPPFEDAVASTSGPSGAPNRYHPVKHYMGFREPRIIFFAESLNAPEVLRWHDQLGGAEREDALVIEVGPLKGDDGWTFVDGRVRKCAHPGVPAAARQTMREVLNDHGPMSLSRLQKACFDLWEEALDSADVDEIGKHDFDRYYNQRADTYRRRVRGRRNGHQ
jgi:energy-coupling factor transporter ATP-binding protein EcfA2